jgi:chorismate mutase
VPTLTVEDEITSLRKRIDAIDEQIMILLSKRINISKEIGKTKKRLHKPILDTNREKIIYNRIEEYTKELSISPEDCMNIYKEIIKMCKNAQKSV